MLPRTLDPYTPRSRTRRRSRLETHSLGHTAAATVPLPALTAWQALFDHAPARAPAARADPRRRGRRRQLRRPTLALARGSDHWHTSARNVEFARELGADEAILSVIRPSRKVTNTPPFDEM